jgi:hypothetical protein
MRGKYITRYIQLACLTQRTVNPNQIEMPGNIAADATIQFQGWSNKLDIVSNNEALAIQRSSIKTALDENFFAILDHKN